jgi:hypothetical protein
MCGGTGRVLEGVVCMSCNGRGRVACAKCRNGKLRCKKCKGSGSITNAIACTRCKGKKRIACPTCHGKGYLPPRDLPPPKPSK